MSRWVRLAAATVAMIQIANLQYAWTLFVKPLRDAHGWSLSEVQWGFTIFIAVQTWCMAPAGVLIARFNRRLLMILSGILCAIGWGDIGFATSTWQLYAFYTVAGLGASIVYCSAV